MEEFALVYDPEKNGLSFRARTESARTYLNEHPLLAHVVRTISAAYRGEKRDECTVVSVAEDLERILRIVSGTTRIAVTAMRQERREVLRFLDSSTLTTKAVSETVLVPLVRR